MGWKPENTKGIQAKLNAVPNFNIIFFLRCFWSFIKLYDFVKVATDERLCAPHSSSSIPNELSMHRVCVDVRRFAYFIRNKNKFIFDLCNWLSSFAAVVRRSFSFSVYFIFFFFAFLRASCVQSAKQSPPPPPTSEYRHRGNTAGNKIIVFGFSFPFNCFRMKNVYILRRS